MIFDRQLRPATETSWVVSYDGKTIPRWRAAAILKIDISPYLLTRWTITSSYGISYSVLGWLKPPSHQPRSHYVLQKLSERSKNFVQRSRNAVETDKDVIWSPWTWRTWSNFGHVQKNAVKTWSNQDVVRT